MSTTPNINQTSFLANIEKLDKMISWVRKHAMAAGLSGGELRKLELVIEEVLVNIIQHAYEGENGEVELICRIHPGHQMECVIKDRGFPFNPLLLDRKIKKHRSIDAVKEGGLGIFFMRTLIDDVHYERQDPYNILTLIKKL